MLQTRLLDSAYLLALMVGLYPALFFISNNWFFVGVLQSVLLLGLLSLSAFVALSILHLILSRIPLPGDVKTGLLLLAALALLLRFMKVTLDELQVSVPQVDVRLAIFLVAGAALVLLLALARRLSGMRLNLLRFGNLFLLFMSAAALVNLAISVVTNYERVYGSGAEARLSDTQRQDWEVYRQVRFEASPNIYLIVPDSYPSNPFLKRFFDFDNREFSEQLQAAGFTVYDDYFASYPYSVESMHSMLAMEHNYFAKSIGNDSVDLRRIIGGSDNATIGILRQNGYRSFYLHDSDYLVHRHCRIEACLPRWSEAMALKKNAKDFFDLRLPIDKPDYDVGIAMQAQIDNTEAGSKTFVYKHFMDAHSTVKSYKQRYQRLLPDFRRGYPAKIERVNQILTDEVGQIIGKDPDALIVIVADHGTWAGAERSRVGLEPDETRDKLNVFLAIRWGADYDGRYDERIKTSVNLFRFIFAYLGQDDKILATLKDDAGYFKQKGKVWKVVDKGAVLDEPVRH